MSTIYLVCIIIILFLLLIYVVNRYNIFIGKKNKLVDITKFDYFDYNATCPMRNSTIMAYMSAARIGNASSIYNEKCLGSAQYILDETRHLIASRLSADNTYKVVFNSGASEGNNFVLRYASNKSITDSFNVPHIIMSEIEHKTSLDCAKCLVKSGKIQLSLIRPDITGIIDPAEVEKHIQPNTVLITIMSTNNETGACNDLYAIGNIAKTHNIMFHSDITQSFGKTHHNIRDCNLSAVTLSFHKIYGPPGLGAIVINNIQKGDELISGTQNWGLRGGTENMPAIYASLVSMKTVFTDREKKNKKMINLKHKCLQLINSKYEYIPYIKFAGSSDSYVFDIKNICFTVLGPLDNSLVSPSTLLISFIGVPKVCGVKLREYLYNHRIIVSIGSACNTHITGPSHVLTAIKAPLIVRAGTIRISFSEYNTHKQVVRLVEHICSGIKKQRSEL